MADHNEDIPAEGTCFKTIEDAKVFYKNYAMKVGFTIKTRSTKWDQNHEVRYLILACSREGYRKSRINTIKKTKPTTLANCEARITLSRDPDGVYVIKKFIKEHSHDTSPIRAKFLKENRLINMHAKRVIDVNDDAGVRVNKTFQSLVRGAGGYDEVAFIEKDVRNYLTNNMSCIREQGDAVALMGYFERMKNQNRNFFYEICKDDQQRIKHVFWCDARSRAAYEYFGDVVTFDTTYQTNRYNMPFASFVGVNHHGQSIMLGCALLSCEETEAFVWLFNIWLKCMAGKHPIGILTDQCKAMRNAIELSLPNTRHRLCIWHIMKKIPEKFGAKKQSKEITTEMCRIVWHSRSEDAFNSSWNTFVDKFNLQDNEWLTALYDERARWAPIFLKKYFWAGMSSTQRSESMHSFMKSYLTPRCNLQQFVKQYDNCIASRAYKEREADDRDFNTVVPCATNSLLEKQFQAEYTHSKFEEVQDELRAKVNCTTMVKMIEGTRNVYEVAEEIDINGKLVEYTFEVVIDTLTTDFQCECNLFESRGIVCRHCFCALSSTRVKELPRKYIIDRWSKNVKRNHTRIKCSHDSSHMQPDMKRYDRLCKKFYDIAEVAAHSEELTETIERVLDAGWRILTEQKKFGSMTNVDAEVGYDKIIEQSQVNDIRPPPHVSSKGRKRIKRLKSTVEKIVETSRKRKKTTKKAVVNAEMTSEPPGTCEPTILTDSSCYVPDLSMIGSVVSNEPGTNYQFSDFLMNVHNL